MVVTELQRDGNWAEFVVRTQDAVYQDRLVKMGWRPAGHGSFSRRLRASADVDRIFGNFTEHIVEMLEQSARRRPIPWDAALAEFADRVQHTGLRWWLYGSGALAVRGLDIEPGDLDLAVDDAHLAGAALSDILVEPVTSAVNWVADSGGRAFHGALIEWLSGAHPTGRTPPHEQEPAAAAHLEQISWRGRIVPVPELQLQLAVAQRRGLQERCELIYRALAG